MKQKNLMPHIIAFSALFVMGNAVIALPNIIFNFYFLALSAAISLALIFVSVLMVRCGKKSKIAFYITAVLIWGLALWGAVDAFYDFIKFLTSSPLPQANAFWLSAVLMGIVIVLTLSDYSAFCKYSLFAALLCGAVVVICFITGIKNFDFSLVCGDFDAPQFSLITFINLFLPILLLPFFACGGNRSTKPIFCGIAVGFGALLVCALQTVLTLGVSQDILHPYLKSVSVISSGSLFTRLDGLVYFLFFSTSLIRITGCLKAALNHTLQKEK